MSLDQEIPCLSDPVIIESTTIPGGLNVDIRESTFFQKWDELPSIEDVHSASMEKYSKAYPGRPITQGFYGKPPFVSFNDKNVFVKWGTMALISEGQWLLAIRHYFGAAVPVPEVYGWRQEGNVVYIFMELIRGQTLEYVWDSLAEEERTSICLELRTIFRNLRLGKQDSETPLVGNIKGGPFCDRAIGECYLPECGPFNSVKEFHDWFAFLPRRPMEDPRSVPIEPFRADLCDNIEVKLTNGDLHRRNIIVTAGRSPRVAAITDWEQSGWLPAYWEVRKALWTSWHRSEWAVRYLPMILDLFEITAEPWNYYVSSLGN